MNAPVARCRVEIELDLSEVRPIDQITNLAKALFLSSVYGANQMVCGARVTSCSLSLPLVHPEPEEGA